MTRPTLHDVAARAGVSLTTTSMVLAGKGGRFSAPVQQRVSAAAAALGYERNSAAAALRTGTGDHVAILMPTPAGGGSSRGLLFDSPFFADFFAGFEHAATARGVPFGLNRLSDPVQLQAQLRAHRPRAAVVLGTLPDTLMATIGRWDIPTVVVDNAEGCEPYRDNPHVIDYSLDDTRMGELGMGRLLENGHRRVALLFGPRGASIVHRHRHEGALAALARVPGAQAELVETADVSFEAAEPVAEQVMGALRRGATAILCMADILALGCYASLFRHGLQVPRDVSLCGMDGLRLLNYLPYRLDTVDQRIVDRGMQAAMLLLEGEPGPAIEPVLRPGDTVALRSD